MRENAPRIWYKEGAFELGAMGTSFLPPQFSHVLMQYDPLKGSSTADLDARLEQLAADGVDRELAFPNALLALLHFPDKALREADRYLNEVAGEINKVKPRTKRPYEFRFLGQVNPAMLTQAEVYSGSTRVEGRDVCAFIKVVLRVAPAKPQGASMQGDEIGRCLDYFKAQKTEHELAIEKKNDFGVTTRARVTLSGSPPSEVPSHGRTCRPRSTRSGARTSRSLR